MIIARIESLVLGKSTDDALERALAYMDAGVDGIMIHSKSREGEDICTVASAIRQKNSSIPLVAVPTAYHQLTATALKEAGFNIIIYANHLLRSAYPAMMKTAQSILQHDRSMEAESSLISVKELIQLIPANYDPR